MLCGRLGVRDGEDVGFAAWREKRQGDKEREREENRSLRREVGSVWYCVVQFGLLWFSVVKCVFCGLVWSRLVCCGSVGVYFW